MRSEIVIPTDAGIVVLHDSAVAPAPGTAPRETATLVREAAEAGGLFFIDTDEALDLRVIVTDEELPADLAGRMDPSGGSFLLRLPTGHIAVKSAESWVHARPAAAELEVPPGTYALRAFERKPVDGAAYEREMLALLGDRAWRFRKRVDALGAIGCLALLTLVPLRLVKPWRPAAVYVFAAIALLWALYFLLRRLPAYREIERRRSEHDALQPHFAIKLQSLSSWEGLAGGGISAS